MCVRYFLQNNPNQSWQVFLTKQGQIQFAPTAAFGFVTIFKFYDCTIRPYPDNYFAIASNITIADSITKASDSGSLGRSFSFISPHSSIWASKLA